MKIRSLWGEVFYRLGGEKALKALGKADDPEGSPSEAQIEAVFPSGPVLLLFETLLDTVPRRAVGKTAGTEGGAITKEMLRQAAAVAKAYQDSTGWHLKHPRLD